MKIDLLLVQTGFRADEEARLLTEQMRSACPDHSSVVDVLQISESREWQLDGLDGDENGPVHWAVKQLSARPWVILRCRLGIAIVARVGACRAFLESVRERRETRSWYYDVDLAAPFLRQCAFGDYDYEGGVCWDVAKAQGESVLVLCDFSNYGDWWRPTTAQAEPLAVRSKIRFMDHAQVCVVYRVRSRDVLLALWSRTSYDDGIAYICASDDGAPESLFDLNENWREDALFAYTHRHAWVYRQRYGGGADEHYAQFAAADPKLCKSVFEHMRQRANITQGCWLAGHS